MPDIQKSRKILFLNKEKTGSYQSRIAPEAATKRANLMIASRSVRRGIGRAAKLDRRGVSMISIFDRYRP